MTLEEKQDLSRLLRRYQEDLLEANNSKIGRASCRERV